jgi:hypothetical protein
MQILVLPLLDSDVRVADGLNAARAHRVGGIVSNDGSGFWLHRFDELANATRSDPSQELAQLPRHPVHELQASDAAAHGLSLTRPNDAIFGPYLDGLQEDFRVTATANDFSTAGHIAVLAAKSTSAVGAFATYPKAWFCPKNSSEVWDDTNKPSSGRCPTHGIALVEDK